MTEPQHSPLRREVRALQEALSSIIALRSAERFFDDLHYDEVVFGRVTRLHPLRIQTDSGTSWSFRSQTGYKVKYTYVTKLDHRDPELGDLIALKYLGEKEDRQSNESFKHYGTAYYLYPYYADDELLANLAREAGPTGIERIKQIAEQEGFTLNLIDESNLVLFKATSKEKS